MLPDPGCYEERYRMAAGAAVGLFTGLMTIGLAFLTVAPWVAGLVIAAAFLALMGPGLAARRLIAFRADYAGVTLGAVPGKLIVRQSPAVFIPWGDVEKIIFYPAGPGGHDANDQVQCLGVQRRERSPALAEGNEPAPGCPVPGVAAGRRAGSADGGLTASASPPSPRRWRRASPSSTPPAAPARALQDQAARPVPPNSGPQPKTTSSAWADAETLVDPGCGQPRRVQCPGT